MADTFVLSDYGGTVTYNFLTGYIKLASDGWTVYNSGPELWTETCLLVANDADINVIDAAAEIDVLVQMARKFHESNKVIESVWLKEYGDTENAKRALVYNIEFNPIPRGNITPLLGQGGAFYQIAITRGAWEGTTATTLGTQSNVSSYAGSFAITDTTAGGTKSNRISTTTFTGVSGSGPLDRVWIGIKPTREGTAGFEPRWEAEDAYYTHGDCGTAQKSGAYPSGSTNCQVMTFTTASYTNRFMIKLENVVGSYWQHMAGRYLALMRYQVPTSDGVLYVGLMQGIGQYAHTAPIQYISYTSGYWRYLPMGIVDIPPPSWRQLAYGNLYIRNFTLAFYAGESEGTSTELWVDSILLVPYEHFFYTSGSALQDTGTATVSVLYTHEDSENEALSFDTNGQVDKVLLKNPNKWWLPNEGGKVVVVAERSDRSNMDDVLDVNMQWFRRYGTHRDA